MAKGLNVFVNIGAKVAGSVNSSASAVEKRFTAMGRNLKLASAEMSVAMTRFQKASSGIGGLLAAGGIGFTLKKALGAGAELDHEIQALRNAGRTSQQVAMAIAAANKTILELPTSTLASNIAMISETTSAFGDYGNAVKNVGRNQKLAFLLNNSAGTHGEDGQSTGQIGNLIRTLEMRGAANDEGRYARETEMAYKAMIFTKGRVGGNEFKAFASTGNPLVKSLSDDYLYKIAPSLMQEYGADQAGTMHQSLANTILGKVGMGGATYAKEWMRLGMLDRSQAKFANNGSVKGWMAGAIAGTPMFLRDPLKWSENYLLPALKKAGVNVDDQVATQIELSKLIGKNTASRLLGSLINTNDRKRLHKDAAFTDEVPGVDRTYLNTLLNDPKAGPAALKSSMTNLLGAISAPLLLPLARALVSIADGVNRIAVVFQNHPGLGKAVGGLTLALSGMIGLAMVGQVFNFIGAGLGVFTTAAMIAGRAGGAALTGLVGLFIRMTPTVAGMTFEFTALGASIAAAFWPITIAVVGIGLALAFIIAKWNGIKAFFKGFGEGFSKALSPETKAAMSKFGDAIKTVFGAIGVVLSPVAKALGWIWDKLSMIFAPANAKAWHGAGASFGAVIGGMANGLVSFISRLVELIARLGQLGAAGGALGMMRVAPTHAAPHRASGGPVSRGGLYGINERGQELFVPGRSGTIIPARATAALIAAMSGGLPAAAHTAAPVNATFYIQSHDPAGVRQEVCAELKRLAASQSAYLSD